MIGQVRARMGEERGQVSTSLHLLHHLADHMDVLAAHVAAVSPCRRDPEQFHGDTDDLAHARQDLARELRSPIQDRDAAGRVERA